MMDMFVDFLANNWPLLSTNLIAFVAIFLQWRSYKRQFEEQLFVDRNVYVIGNTGFIEFNVTVRNKTESQWDVKTISVKTKPKLHIYEASQLMISDGGGGKSLSHLARDTIITHPTTSKILPEYALAAVSMPSNHGQRNWYSHSFLVDCRSVRKRSIKISCVLSLASNKSIPRLKTITINKTIMAPDT